MTEEKKKPVKKVDHKQELADHQEYCKLKLEYENLRKESRGKYSKLDRMKELEGILKKVTGKKATTKKTQGVAKLSMKGKIVYITQDLPNPKFVTNEFSDTQKEHYFA